MLVTFKFMKNKRDSLSISELSFDVDTWDNESPVYEDIEEEPVLTSLVRHQYMKKLQQCLHENFLRYDKSKDVGESPKRIEKRLDKYAQILERKALRSCMVAKVYIRSMLTIVEDINKRNINYSLLNTIEKKNVNISLNDLIQTTVKDTQTSSNTDVKNTQTFSKTDAKDTQTSTKTDAKVTQTFSKTDVKVTQTSCETDAKVTQTSSETDAKVTQTSFETDAKNTQTSSDDTVQMKIPTMDEIRNHLVQEEVFNPTPCNNIPFLSEKDLNDVSSILDNLPLNLSPPVPINLDTTISYEKISTNLPLLIPPVNVNTMQIPPPKMPIPPPNIQIPPPKIQIPPSVSRLPLPPPPLPSPVQVPTYDYSLPELPMQSLDQRLEQFQFVLDSHLNPSTNTKVAQNLEISSPSSTSTYPEYPISSTFFSEQLNSSSTFLENHDQQNLNSQSSEQRNLSSSSPERRNSRSTCTKRPNSNSTYLENHLSSSKNYTNRQTKNKKRKSSQSYSQVKKRKKIMKVNSLEIAKKKIEDVIIEDEQKLFEERVCLMYKLEQELTVLNPIRRDRLEKLYLELFGPGHNYYLELSEERQYEIAKRRIANMVVTQLEPFYCKENKKIGNKSLFKFLARYITDAIFNINPCADTIEIKQRVGEFFVNGRQINCESDIYGIY